MNNPIIKTELETHMLHDRLHILASEMDVSVDSLVNAALRRLINDVSYFQELRKGRIPYSPVKGE